MIEEPLGSPGELVVMARWPRLYLIDGFADEREIAQAAEPRDQVLFFAREVDPQSLRVARAGVQQEQKDKLQGG